MKPKMTIILAFLLSLWSIEMIAQERDYSIFSKSEKLELQSLEALIEEEAKAELKKAVKTINTQLDNDEISEEDAEKLKTEAADESAKNIEELQDLLYTWASYQKRNFDKINFDDIHFHLIINTKMMTILKNPKNHLKNVIYLIQREPTTASFGVFLLIMRCWMVEV